MSKPVTLPTTVAALGAAVNDIATYSNYFLDSGSANTMVVTLTSGLTFSYVAGVGLQVQVAATNTGPSTINVNGLGAKNVTNSNLTALSAGQLIAGAIVILIYDGTRFQLTGLVFPQTAGEAAAGVTPTNTTYQPGDLRRYGAIGNSSTDSSTAIQNALNASAGYNAVYVPANAGQYFRLTQRVYANENTHIVMESGSILQWTATTSTGSQFPKGLGSASNPGIEVLGDNFLLEGKGQLIGPSNDIYVLNEMAILRVGPSASSRGTGLVIRDVEMFNWGSYGIATQFIQKHQVIGCHIHNTGYSSITALSGQEIRILHNELDHITPGTGSQCYGLNMSHDSTNYSSDPNASSLPRQTVNPFCIDVEIAFNLVHDIPLWEGILCSGGYEVRIHNNAVYNCAIGIQCSGSSGAAANFAGENNSVTENVIYALQMNGNASQVTAGFTNGIIVNGGSSTNGSVGFHRGVVVTGNHIYGMGDPEGVSGMSIQATFVRSGVITGNVIRAAYGQGIYGASFDGAISGNLFAAPGQTANSTCIYLAGSNAECTINGNKHSSNGGNVYAVGINMSSSSATNVVCGGNDMSVCTTPFGSGMAFLTRGISDLPPRIEITTAPSGGVVNLSGLGQAPDVWVDLEPSAAFTLKGFQGSEVGQRVHVSQLTNVTVTVNDSTGALKLVGGTAAMTQFSTMEFLCVSTANPTHLEKSRALGLS